MKKQILLSAILTLSLAGWLSACGSNQNVGEDQSDTSAQFASAKIPGGQAHTSDDPPATSGSEGVAPVLPPPVSAVNFLADAHRAYSEQIGIPQARIEKCWMNSGHESPFIYQDAAFLNGFLKFVQCADPEINVSLEKSKLFVRLAHQASVGSDATVFGEAIRSLSSENESLRARILQAASLYQVPVSVYDYSPSDISPASKQFNAAVGKILTQTPVPKGAIFLDEIAEQDAQTLVESVSLSFTATDGSQSLVSFENFSSSGGTFPLVDILFAFELGRGGFGLVKTEEIHF